MVVPNELPFHSLAEFFTVALALSIVMMTWNSRRFFSNHFLFFIGVSFFFVGVIDLVSALTLQNLEMQLWLGARITQISALFASPLFLKRKITFRVFGAIALAVLLLLVFLILLKGELKTPAANYLVAALALSAIGALYKNRKPIGDTPSRFLVWSLVLSAGAEIPWIVASFTRLPLELFPHALNIGAFYLVYRAITETVLRKPYDLLLKNIRTKEEDLQDAERKFRFLIESAASAIILTNGEGNITVWNDGASRMFGYEQKEIIGKSFTLLMPERDRKEPGLVLQQFTKDHGNQDGKFTEYQGIRKNGEEFPIDISVSHWGVEEKQFFGAIIHDITERHKNLESIKKQTEKLQNFADELAKFKLAMENVSEHIVITDPNGVIMYANKAASEITGYTQKELTGARPSLWGRQKDDAFYKKLWHTIKVEKKTFTGEFINKRKNGQLYIAEAIISPILDKSRNVRFFIGIERDITLRRQREKTLEESRQFIQRILDTSPNTIVIFDFEAGKDMYINRRSKELLFHEDDRDALKKYREKLMYAKDGTLETITFRAREKQGSWRWFNAIATVFTRNPQDQVRQALAVFEDITEMKQNEQKLRLYTLQLEYEKAESEALLSNIGDAICAVDPKGTILFTNAALGELAGIAPNMMRGKPINEILPLQDRNGNSIQKEVRPHALVIATKKKFTTEPTTSSNYYFAKGGKAPIPLSITTTPIISGKRVAGTISVFRDITKEKEIDKYKTEFISLAAHQLRTPLTTMSLLVQMALQGATGKVNKAAKKYFRDLRGNIATMTGLIETFLNISRIELGTFPINPQPLRLLDMVRDALNERMSEIKRKKIKLKKIFDKSIPVLKLDRKIIGIVLDNLISNALKYTPEKGSIVVGVRKQGHDIILSVSDTGYGIPSHQASQIFTKMFRAENVEKLRVSGVGLGLYITKAVLEQSGGKIWFESKLNKGTTFFVSIPLSGTQPHAQSR